MINFFLGIINLEKSNKWPNNFDAVQRIKKGFQLEISRAIKSQLNLQVRNHVDFFDVYKVIFISFFIPHSHNRANQNLNRTYDRVSIFT